MRVKTEEKKISIGTAVSAEKIVKDLI